VDAVVIAGGDGTVNEALNGMLGSGSALGIIPCGTANDLADHLSIPNRPEDAVAVILRGHTRRIDLIRVNGWHLATTGGVGVAADVIRLADAIKYTRAGRYLAAVLGSTLYLLLLALTATRQGRETYRLYSQAGVCSRCSSVFSLTLSNIPRLAGHFQLAPGANDRDGRLHLCCIQNSHGLLNLLKSILGTLTGSPQREADVMLSQVQSLMISCDQPSAFFGDGKIGVYGDRFRLDLIPAALPVLVPDRSSENEQ
jgi:diacylglycerol kinase family enzyme